MPLSKFLSKFATIKTTAIQSVPLRKKSHYRGFAIFLIQVSAANKEQRHMEVINCCVKPLVQIIFRQNIRFRHALKEMAQYKQYTSNNFYIINPFFSCSYRCLFTHYFVSICCAISASTISSPVLCFSCSLLASLRPLLITQFISQVLHLSSSSLVTLPSR